MRERPILMSGPMVRAIPSLGCEKYAASPDGHIFCFSRARNNAKKSFPFVLSESVGSGGYPFVAIIIGGRKRNIPIHRLVCEAWHGEKPSAAHEVRHLDGNKRNNCAANLAWGTRAENEADKRRHGRVAEGERHGEAKLIAEAVRILRIAIPRGLWNPIDAAKVFGVGPSTIRAAVSGKTWRYGSAITFRPLEVRNA